MAGSRWSPIQLHDVWILFTIVEDGLGLTRVELCRIRLINVNGFLEREKLIREGKPVDSRTKVFEPGDDEATKYAIISHRWIEGAEVDYQEMTKLAEMKEAKQNEIRERLGYKKITRSVSTSQTSPSSPGRSNPCTGGMKTQAYATRTSMTLPTCPFPLQVARGGTPIPRAGQCGSPVAGPYRR